MITLYLGNINTHTIKIIIIINLTTAHLSTCGTVRAHSAAMFVDSSAASAMICQYRLSMSTDEADYNMICMLCITDLIRRLHELMCIHLPISEDRELTWQHTSTGKGMDECW